MTLVERKTGLARLRRVDSGAADPTMRTIAHALYPLCARVHTLTWDNGSESTGHASDFAEPYSAWQRGCNENFNGLLRQHFPKGCDLGAFTEAQVQAIEDRSTSGHENG